MPKNYVLENSFLHVRNFVGIERDSQFDGFCWLAAHFIRTPLFFFNQYNKFILEYFNFSVCPRAAKTSNASSGLVLIFHIIPDEMNGEWDVFDWLVFFSFFYFLGQIDACGGGDKMGTFFLSFFFFFSNKV